MARFVIRYRCPDCAEVFTYPANSPEDAPDRCQVCGAWMSDSEPDDKPFVPMAPAIRRSPYAKSVDQTYRAMETASIERAEEAAGLLESQYANQPHDEFETGLLKKTQRDEVAGIRSDLKITNMKDPSQMREGESAAIMPAAMPSPTTQGAGFQTFVGKPTNHAPGVGGISMPDTISRFTRDHTPRAMQMIRAGNIGKG